MADVTALKRELAALGAATEAGFEAGGEAVERIKALAAELEAANPTPNPASAAELLRGRWKLLYSSFGLNRNTTLSRLSFNLLPKTPIRVTELHQEVDPATGLYDNAVGYEGGVQVTLGQYVPQSEHRLGVKFTHAQATGHARVDITNAKIPPLHSDVTFLDEDFRLNRGGYGNLYVLQLVDRAPARWFRDS